MQPVRVGAVELGGGPPAVIVPLMARTSAELGEQAHLLAAQAEDAGIDLVEWRIDALEDDPVPAAAALAAAVGNLPVLATVRTHQEGGLFTGDDAAYARLLAAVLRSGVAGAIDVELTMPDPVREQIMALAQQLHVPVVLSRHYFDHTPPEEELVGDLRAMADAGGDVLKIAVMPRTPADVLTLLTATLAVSSQADQPIITMSMGGLGAASRMLGELVGSCATFATAGSASAPGQLPVAELVPVLRLIHRGLQA